MPLPCDPPRQSTAGSECSFRLAPRPSAAPQVALRLARLLAFPELAANGATSAFEAGIDPLPAEEEASARRTLAAVATALSTQLEETMGGSSSDSVQAAARLPGMASEPAYASQLLAAYVEEKCRVLRESAQALQR
jgi:hypothetical protein